MAIAASVIWEIRGNATAGNANGGGFKPGATGVDYSQQAAAQYNLTGVTSAGAGAVALTASAAADMVGNIAHVISGTNFTPGWYEIISVVVGVSITFDSNITSGVGSIGVINIGGAISLNSATANQTDTNFAAALIAGNTVFVNGSGSITVAATFTVTAGASGTPINFVGYSTARGDNPTVTGRPVINCSTFTWTSGGNNIYSYLSFTGTAANMFTYSGAAQSLVKNCKFVNTSQLALRTALNAAASNGTIISCEAISYNGNALNLGSTVTVFGSYFHDSVTGVLIGGTSAFNFSNNIVESCSSQSIYNTGPVAAVGVIANNTLYGAENKFGTGIAIPGASTGLRIINNILYGFTTGIIDSNAIGVNFGDFNNSFNNTVNYSNFTVGSGSTTLNPSFMNVVQISSQGASISSATLTSVGQNFTGVVPNQDFCFISSGSFTIGQYLITSLVGSSSITLSSSPGTGSASWYQITTGRNFQIGNSALPGKAIPNTFPAGLTISSTSMGAAQRSFSGSSGGSVVTIGYSF